MMNFIRENMQSRWFRVIIWFSIFALVMTGPLTYFFMSKNISTYKWAARVNGSDIDYSDLEMAAAQKKEQINQIKRIFGEQANSLLHMWGITPDKSVYDVALEELIENKALAEEAEKVGINVSHDYVIDKINDFEFVQKHLSGVLPQYLYKDGKLDSSVLNAVLKEGHLSAEKFDNQIKDALQTQTYLELLKAGDYVSKADLEKKFVELHSPKKYEIITISEEPFVRQAEADQTLLTDKNIDKYYNDNKAKYRVQESRSGKSWEFEVEDQKKFVEEAKAAIADKAKFAEFVKKGKQANVSGSTKDLDRNVTKLFDLKAASDKTYYVAGNKGHLVELSKINESYIPTKDKVLAELKKDILKAKTTELLNAALKSAEEKAKTISFAKLAPTVNGKFKSTESLDPVKLVNKEYKDLDLPTKNLTSIAHMTTLNGITTDIDNKKGYLVKLVNIEPIKEEEFLKERQSLYADLVHANDQKYTKTVKDAIRDNSKIILNKEILSKLKNRK